MQQGNAVLLKWTAAEGNPIGYKVYSGINEVATVANTEYIFETLASGKYIFGVEALFEYYCKPVIVNIKFIVDEVGIDEVGISDLILIYPNPTDGQLTIDNGELTIENVEIFDLLGRLQKTGTSSLRGMECRSNLENDPTGLLPASSLAVRNDVSEVSIDISNLPSGMYFIRIQTKNGIITKKIIKMSEL
jgi:hypothetical protein